MIFGQVQYQKTLFWDDVGTIQCYKPAFFGLFIGLTRSPLPQNNGNLPSPFLLVIT